MVNQFYKYDKLCHLSPLENYGLNSLSCPIGKQQCCLLSLPVFYFILSTWNRHNLLPPPFEQKRSV